jgi:DNA-binding transcriptional LysR family regulator
MGNLFADEARRILDDVDLAKERVRRAAGGYLGKLRVGFQSVNCRNRVVSTSLLAFREKHTQIDLRLTPMTAESLIDHVRAGELDAGFVNLPADFPDLRRVHLQTLGWVLAMPATHALANRRRLCLADLQNEGFVWLPRAVGPVLYDRMIAACQAGGLEPRIVQEAFEETMMISLVSVGMGVSFVIDTARNHWPEGLVTFRRVDDFSVPLHLSLIWRAEDSSPLLKRLIDIVQDVQTRQSAA